MYWHLAKERFVLNGAINFFSVHIFIPLSSIVLQLIECFIKIVCNCSCALFWGGDSNIISRNNKECIPNETNRLDLIQFGRTLFFLWREKRTLLSTFWVELLLSLSNAIFLSFFGNRKGNNSFSCFIPIGKENGGERK